MRLTSRRRLLQVLLAAPFAPWQEILEEASKPKIFYSIPENVSVLEGPLLFGDRFDVKWTQEYHEYLIRAIAYSFGVPEHLLHR